MCLVHIYHSSCCSPPLHPPPTHPHPHTRGHSSRSCRHSGLPWDARVAGVSAKKVIVPWLLNRHRQPTGVYRSVHPHCAHQRHSNNNILKTHPERCHIGRLEGVRVRHRTVLFRSSPTKLLQGSVAVNGVSPLRSRLLGAGDLIISSKGMSHAI